LVHRFTGFRGTVENIPQREEKIRPHQEWRGNKNPPLNKCPLLLEKICLVVDE